MHAAQKGAAQLRGCSIALRVQHNSVQRSIAQQGTVQLNSVQRSSIGCGVAQEGAAQLSRVQITLQDATQLSRVQRSFNSLIRVRWVGCGAGNIMFQSLGGPVVPGGPSSGLRETLYFLGCRVAQIGCDVAQLNAAQLSRMQRSSEGYSVAQKVEAQIRGCSVALRAQRSSERVQRSSEGCSLGQQGAAELLQCSKALRVQSSSNRVQRSSVGCSVAQQGAAQLSRVQRSSGGVVQLSKLQRSSVGCSLAQQKNICPSLGLKEDILFLEYFFYFWGMQRSCDGRAGRAAPRQAWQCAKKDGCGQRTGAHARP